MLPHTGEWVPDSITARNPMVGDAADLRECVIELTATRNYAIFVAKQIITSVLVVYGGLCALFLSSDVHTGDRAGLILVAALILMVSFQTDLGLGAVTYLTWWDVFNLASMAVLIFVLVVALIEHNLMRTGQTVNSLALNQAVSVVTVAGIYPFVLLWLLLIGIHRSYTSPSAWAVLIIGEVSCAIVAIVWFRHNIAKASRERREVIRALQQADMNSEAFPEVVQQAFKAFDADGSGDLDIKELRHLLKAMLGGVDAKAFSEVMLEIRKFANKDGALSLDAFNDAIAIVRERHPLRRNLKRTSSSYRCDADIAGKAGTGSPYEKLKLAALQSSFVKKLSRNRSSKADPTVTGDPAASSQTSYNSARVAEVECT